MKLYHAPSSPYVRKVLVAAHELDLADEIELIPVSSSGPTGRLSAADHNPLGKIPTLVTDDELALYDSPVICEYLDSYAKSSHRLFPSDPSERWRALTLQALGDGIMEAAQIARYEDVVRPESARWSDWKSFQLSKVSAALDHLESDPPDPDAALSIGDIATACALAYIEFRHASFDWRSSRPMLARWFEAVSARPSMSATKHV